MIELIILLLLIIYTYLLGKRILNLFKVNFSRLSESVILSVSMGFGLLVTFLFFLGIAGLFYSWLIRTIIIVSFIILLYLDGRKEFEILKNYFKDLSWKLPFGYWVLLIICGLYILFNLINCLTPVSNVDSLFVYLNHARLFVENHSIYNIDWGGIAASYRPLNAIILNSLGILLCSDILSQLITGWLMGFLSALAVYSISRNFANRRMSLIAAIVFYCIPTLSWLIFSTKIDMTYAAFELCFWLLFVKWLYSKDKKYLFISAVYLGFAIGTKYQALYALLFNSLVVLIIMVFERIKFKDVIIILLIFFSITILVCAPSYIRSLILTGDPVYPFLSKGNYIKESILHSNNSSNHINYFHFQYQLIFGKSFPLKPYSIGDRPIGFLVFIILPALFISRSTIASHKKTILIFIGYYLFSSFMTNMTSEHFPRHFLPAIGLISSLNSLSFREIKKYIPESLILIVFNICLITMVLFADIGLGPRIRPRHLLKLKLITGEIKKETYLEETVFKEPRLLSGGMIKYINKMQPDTKIFALQEISGYYAQKPIIIKRGFVDTLNCEIFFNKCSEYGITHLLFSKNPLFEDDYLGVHYQFIKDIISDPRCSLEYNYGDQYLFRIEKSPVTSKNNEDNFNIKQYMEY